ncbi:MAG: DUF2298 domain-containing protein [Candidatus Daviesbacteria bacterium]|nr:DUF2298 domain-containing protein [Candidatus Daviesbacteria bacterium]
MLISDLLLETNWWLILLVLGLIFLPITSLIFKSFFDKGYIFSKILGMLFVSYLVWLIASLKILPFNFLLISITLLIFSLINIALLVRYKLVAVFKRHLWIFIMEEATFLTGFLFWSYIKAHEPSIHGLEKFMDFGFINSLLRSDFFPPSDMWLTPLSINYYYFGHLVTAVLIKLSTVPPEIGYNLMLTSLFGLTLAASFSIGANLYNLFLRTSKSPTINKTLIIIAGFLSAFLVTLGGNLHTIYIFFQSYIMEDPIAFWNLPAMLNLNGYWYPNATRFIPFTIHEFPIYSFVVSDLHGHVLNIPFVLLLIALLMVIFFQHKLNSYCLILISLLIAIFLMTNFLDAPIYLLIIFIVLVMRKRTIQLAFFGIPFFTQIAKKMTMIVFFAILFSLPFWLSFKPFGSGIGVVCAPLFLTNMGHVGPFLFEADHCARSPFWMLLILWGFPLFILLAFLFKHLDFAHLKLIKNLKFKIYNSVDILAITFSVTAFILILIPEFLYVKDIYPAHYRANTVFKFGYQAFIILGLMSGYMITRFFLNLKSFILKLIFVSLFFLVAIYPYFAINSYFNNLNNYTGLNGLSWLQNSYPADYEAITWINQNISNQPVILEAQGDSYSDFARVSANTGLPTVIGWTVHEWLWRGSYDEPGKRVEDVKQLYESEDLNLTNQLIQKYKIKYIFIGALEKQKYTNLNENKFKNLGEIVFENNQTRVYQIF